MPIKVSVRCSTYGIGLYKFPYWKNKFGICSKDFDKFVSIQVAPSEVEGPVVEYPSSVVLRLPDSVSSV